MSPSAGSSPEDSSSPAESDSSPADSSLSSPSSFSPPLADPFPPFWARALAAAASAAGASGLAGFSPDDSSLSSPSGFSPADSSLSSPSGFSPADSSLSSPSSLAGFSSPSFGASPPDPDPLTTMESSLTASVVVARSAVSTRAEVNFISLVSVLVNLL